MRSFGLTCGPKALQIGHFRLPKMALGAISTPIRAAIDEIRAVRAGRQVVLAPAVIGGMSRSRFLKSIFRLRINQRIERAGKLPARFCALPQTAVVRVCGSLTLHARYAP